MIYGLSIPLFLLAFIAGIPALRQLRRMRAVNRNCDRTAGEVAFAASSLGWLWTSTFGNVSRPLIRYRSPAGTEMAIEVATSSVFPGYRYEGGATVEVVYDRDMPGRAYAAPEWAVVRRELWIAVGSLLLAILCLVIGFIYVQL
jgi:hypothetical protein